MNLRLSSICTRLRLSRDELAALARGESLEECAVLPGGQRFSWRVGAARALGEWNFRIELAGEELETLAHNGELALDGLVIEIDAFSGERRARKEKRNDSILASNGSR